MDKKISIISVNLNNAEGLHKTMLSVFSQTYPLVEYIIIDGGSTDGSVNLVTTNHERINYWISEKDSGIYNAMNKGWKKATGDYCFFLNSGDVLIEKNTLEAVSKKLDLAVEIIFGDVIKNHGSHQYVDTHPKEYDLYTLMYKNLPHQGCFIKRQLLEELNGYDEQCRVVSDWVFYTRALIEKNATIKKIDVVISIFDMGGISNRQNSDQEAQEAIDRYFPFLTSVFKTFQKLRYYELSRPHKYLELLLQKVKKSR